MFWENIQPIIVSVGVASAILALVANVVVACMNNRQLRIMNRDKFNNELIQYRYTKLHSILEDIGKEQGFQNYINDPQKTYLASFEKIDRFIELYTLAKPLIGTKLRKNLDSAANSVLTSRSIIMSNPNDLDAVNKEMPNWVSAINHFYHELLEAIQQQVSEFTDVRTK